MKHEYPNISTISETDSQITERMISHKMKQTTILI